MKGIMAIDPSIFKAYDIRGTYPNQLNGEIAYQIGAALAGYLKPKAIAVAGPLLALGVEALHGSAGPAKALLVRQPGLR